MTVITQASTSTMAQKNGSAKFALNGKTYMLGLTTVERIEPNKCTNDGNPSSEKSTSETCFHEWEGPYVTIGDAYGTARCKKCKKWDVLHLRDMTWK